MTQKVLDLAEKAARYKRGGNHLLNALAEVQTILHSLFGDYAQFRFIHEGVAYLENLASSNIADYGDALCYVEPHGQGHRGYKPMPSQWSNAGDGYYLHNDFHVWIDTATRAEVVKVAQDLPAFLESLAGFLEEKGSINDKSAAEILIIAGNLRSAVK